jgi:hypothetical protein
MKCLFFFEITFFFEFSTEKPLPLRAKFLENLKQFLSVLIFIEN